MDKVEQERVHACHHRTEEGEMIGVLWREGICPLCEAQSAIRYHLKDIAIYKETVGQLEKVLSDLPPTLCEHHAADGVQVYYNRPAGERCPLCINGKDVNDMQGEIDKLESNLSDAEEARDALDRALTERDEQIERLEAQLQHQKDITAELYDQKVSLQVDVKQLNDQIEHWKKVSADMEESHKEHVEEIFREKDAIRL